VEKVLVFVFSHSELFRISNFGIRFITGGSMDRRNLFKKKRGAQPGNQNARKHGFYSDVMTAQDLKNYKKAVHVHGLDSEINLIRFQIRCIQEADPGNVRALSQATLALARLIKARGH
jgi:hypothetical protein